MSIALAILAIRVFRRAIDLKASSIQTDTMNQTKTEIQYLDAQKRSVESLTRSFFNLDNSFKRLFGSFQDESGHDEFLDLRMFRMSLSGESQNRRTSICLEGSVARFTHLAKLVVAADNELKNLQSWLLGMSHLEGTDLQGHEAFSTWSHVQKSFNQYRDAQQSFLDAATLTVNHGECGVSTKDRATVEKK